MESLVRRGLEKERIREVTEEKTKTRMLHRLALLPASSFKEPPN